MFQKILQGGSGGGNTANYLIENGIAKVSYDALIPSDVIQNSDNIQFAYGNGKETNFIIFRNISLKVNDFIVCDCLADNRDTSSYYNYNGLIIAPSGTTPNYQSFSVSNSKNNTREVIGYRVTTDGNYDIYIGHYNDYRGEIIYNLLLT